MIKANELRIGNWFMSAKHDVPFQWQASDFAEAYNTEANPIPLTPEILEKAGFVYTEDDSYKIPAKYKGDLEFGIKYYGSINGGQKGYSLENGLGYRVYNHGLLYIHQLQNLYFALCGEELEINLNP